MANFMKGVWAFLVLLLVFGKVNSLLIVSAGLPIMYVFWLLFSRRKQKLLVEDRYIRTKKVDATVVSVVVRSYSSPDVVLKICTDWAEELVVIGPKSNMHIQSLAERHRIHIVFVSPADGSRVITGENLLDIRSLEGMPDLSRPNPGYEALKKAFDPS